MIIEAAIRVWIWNNLLWNCNCIQNNCKIALRKQYNSIKVLQRGRVSAMAQWAAWSHTRRACRASVQGSGAAACRAWKSVPRTDCSLLRAQLLPTPTILQADHAYKHAYKCTYIYITYNMYNVYSYSFIFSNSES